MYSDVVFPYTCLQTQPQPSSMSAQAICDVAAWHALIQQVVVEKIQHEVHGGFSCGSAFLPCTLLRTSLRRGTHWVKPTWHAVRQSVDLRSDHPTRKRLLDVRKIQGKTWGK